MNQQRSLLRNMASARGFTLIELLLVVFILAAVAATAISFVDQDDQQLRYEDTQRRLKAIRRAVIGPEPGTGPILLGGFMADVGRLPTTIEELLDPGAAIPAFQVHPNLGIGAGWRGPYLSVLPRLDGRLVYPDGWGLRGNEPPNYGWDVTVDALANSLQVESYGSDGEDGGSDLYARDYPTTTLVTDRDVRVDLAGWTVVCTIENDGAATFNGKVRMRLVYPEEGSLAWALTPTNWPATSADRDLAPYLSEAEDFSAAPILQGANSGPVSFLFSGAKLVPCGVRALILVDDANGEPLGTLANGAGPALQVALVPRTDRPVGLTFTWRIVP